MFKPRGVFSGFSVDNLEQAKAFYVEKLGLELAGEAMGLRLKLPSGGQVFVYQKDDHQPATYTHLNFVVEDIDQAVAELAGLGIQFERYEGMSYQDEQGIARGLKANMGPDIAWFKDPAGNILAVLQDK